VDVEERIAELAEPICRRAGVQLVDVEFKRPTLRVTVDRPGGVDIGAIQDVTRALSNALDRDDPVPGRYTLEVSSPGLERPLRKPDHFRRAVGSDVLVKTREEIVGERRFRGVLTAADDEGITVDQGAPGEASTGSGADQGTASRRFRYEQIRAARTVFEWGPAPRPGRGQRPTATSGSGRRRKPEQLTNAEDS